jgi:triosephosphate isomerase
MRKKIVAGNWKMNTTPEQGVQLVKDILKNLGTSCTTVEYIVCPPYTHLSEVVKIASGTAIQVGAQNCAEETKGAYTGEVSAEMIASMGVRYVILGHSERRQYYGETSATLNKRMKQTYANGLVPIYCVGETLEERESGKLWDVVKAQIEEVVFELSADKFRRMIIAYEPVWAIGTGKVATAEQAQEMHAFIRKTLAAKFGDAAAKTPILYGGSVKPDNAAEIFSKEDVDGGLIGGAALKAEDFLGIGSGFNA